MTQSVNLTRVIVILLFALTFMSIGWIAPALYASYAPNDNIIESHEFTATNASPDADTHYICFDRTVRYETSGRVFTELYLVNDKNERVRTEVSSEAMQRYFQSGRSKVITEMALPSDIHEGEYRYLLVVKLDMADGRVTRTFSFQSEVFHISNGTQSTEISEAC
jgi:hypothetical protein